MVAYPFSFDVVILSIFGILSGLVSSSSDLSRPFHFQLVFLLIKGKFFDIRSKYAPYGSCFVPKFTICVIKHLYKCIENRLKM